MASRSPELGIRQKKRNLAKPNQFNIIRIGKKLAYPYGSGEHRFSGESLVFND